LTEKTSRTPRNAVRVALFKPRAVQKEIYDNLQRFNVLVCHRRMGKTVLCLHTILRKALECKEKSPRYAYIAPLFRQAKQVAWDYLKEYSTNAFADSGAAVKIYENELRVDLPNGARIQLYGADNPDALRGIYLDGVVLDEYGIMKPGLWGEVVRPLLTDRMGWAIFIGTPNGHNEFYDRYQFALSNPGWFACVKRASDTGVVDPAELEQAREEMEPEEFEQEFECSFEAAIRGSFYGELMRDAEEDGRIGSVPYDPAVLVQTAWDLGSSDDTAIWFFQNTGQEVHFIDYLAESGKPLDFFTKIVLEKEYAYQDHILPHDAKAHHLGMNRTIEEQLRASLQTVTVLPRESLENGIQNSRNLIRKSWFDRVNCERGIESLKQYRREYDTSRKVFKTQPIHDWSSHGADAFRYAAQGKQDKFVFTPLKYDNRAFV